MNSEIAELQENARVVAEAMASKHFRAQEQYRRLSTMVSAGITQDGLRECVRAARVIAVTLSNGTAATDGTKFGIGLHAVYHIKVVTGISVDGLSPTRLDADGRPRFAGGVKEWQIERRFSDFRLLHLALSRKCVTGGRCIISFPFLAPCSNAGAHTRTHTTLLSRRQPRISPPTYPPLLPLPLQAWHRNAPPLPAKAAMG